MEEIEKSIKKESKIQTLYSSNLGQIWYNLKDKN